MLQAITANSITYDFKHFILQLFYDCLKKIYLFSWAINLNIFFLPLLFWIYFLCCWKIHFVFSTPFMCVKIFVMSRSRSWTRWENNHYSKMFYKYVCGTLVQQQYVQSVFEEYLWHMLMMKFTVVMGNRRCKYSTIHKVC